MESHTRQRDITVAIVDDFQLVVDGVIAHLADKRLGIEVVTHAQSWAELLADPNFPAEVTVLDLHLGDSINVDTKVHALVAAGSRVVIMSMHTDAAMVSRALKSGALGFVPKTESIAHLVAAIEAAAEGRSYLTGPLASAVERIGDPSGPILGQQEYRALVLYASGRSIREVASEMGTTEETTKSYIKRARRKFRDVGVDLGTKPLLRQHGIREGWLAP